MLPNDEIEVLLKQYEGIIRKIVNKYKVSSFDREDLYQAGLLGLFKAIKNYKEEYNVKLTTYAFKYIIGEVNREYKKLNLYGRVDYNKIRSFVYLNNTLTPEEICKELNISIETFYDAMSRVDQVMYLEDDTRDSIIDNKAYIDLELNKDEELLYQYYVVRRFSQTEIAKLLNVSQSTVSRSIKKLKLKIKERA
ncbi:MAG: sigma-70 family RNA polymerase sigma factor [Bacilli bacterium]|nr:sigma-70 family RNA polymerase sigma factor [Bacilli bacterium]